MILNVVERQVERLLGVAEPFHAVKSQQDLAL
jgi:hypothetical protein